MSSSNSKFYHIITYASLIVCCALCLFYTFVFSIVREKDIERFRVSEQAFITNVYNAVSLYMTNILTNSPSYQNINNSTPKEQPKVIVQPFGYYETLHGQKVAVFQDGSEYTEGDYLQHGLILKITEKSIYCNTYDKKLTIIKSGNFQKTSEDSPFKFASGAPRATPQTTEEDSEETEDFLN